jgi:hypothetical protein
MPAIVTFDGPNKIITELAAGSVNSLDLTEIYSEWKEWVQLSDNAKFLQAFSVVGGDPISGTQNLGSTFFLENGWRIRPAELNHKLIIVGNVFTREAGQSAFLATLGAFTVNTETQVSPLVQEVSTAGSIIDAADIELIKQALVGNISISSDDQTVTIFAANGVTPLAVLTVSADARTRIRTS